MVTESMASSIAALILFFLGFAAASAPAPAGSPSSLDAVCGTVEYPPLCRKLIETYHPASVQALMESSYQETVKTLKLGRLKCDAISRLFAKNDTNKARDITACCNSYQEVGDELQEKAFVMIENGDGESLLSAGSRALSSVGGCYYLFDVDNAYSGAMKFPGSHIYYNLVKHLTNMLSLSCQVFPSVCPQRPSV